MANSDDPFGHLHDEDYARPFDAGRVGAEAMIAMAGRVRRPLAGEWRFVLDLHDEGLRQRWYAAPDVPLDAWTIPRDYDDGAWQIAAVPASWNLLKPEWFHFEGSAWYTRRFDHAPAAPGNRLFLRVGAANYEARVFLNGRFAGSHRGGSTPFFIELTGLVHAGANRLQIQVENRRERHRVPMNHIDWFNYGGIYREIDLVEVPPVFIRDFSLALVPGTKGGRIRVAATLSEAIDGFGTLAIAGLGGERVVSFRGGRAELEFDAAPALWAPANPQLYDVALGFGEDRLTDRIGFREIAVDGTRILLNGDDLFLAGICVHEDDLELGKVTNDGDIRRRLQHLKAMNGNFLRLAHYPHHERVAEIADEEGILLWAEIPVYWAIDFGNPETLADADNQLRELIRRDQNRASVIIWGIGNENADTDARLGFMRHLAATARAADGTRLVSAACLINRETFRIADRLAEALDLIGINEYFGWYEPSFDGLKRLLANSSPEKPVIIAETGADALAGRRGDARLLFSEDHQANMLDTQLTILRGAAAIRGVAPWILYDFRSPRRQTALQQGFNLKGVIGADKATKKLGFAVLARHYAEIATAQRARGA